MKGGVYRMLTEEQGNKGGKGKAGEVREVFQESRRTDCRREPQGGRHRARTGTSLCQAAGPEED